MWLVRNVQQEILGNYFRGFKCEVSLNTAANTSTSCTILQRGIFGGHWDTHSNSRTAFDNSYINFFPITINMSYGKSKSNLWKWKQRDPYCSTLQWRAVGSRGHVNTSPQATGCHSAFSYITLLAVISIGLSGLEASLPRSSIWLHSAGIRLSSTAAVCS